MVGGRGLSLPRAGRSQIPRSRMPTPLSAAGNYCSRDTQAANTSSSDIFQDDNTLMGSLRADTADTGSDSRKSERLTLAEVLCLVKAMRDQYAALSEKPGANNTAKMVSSSATWVAISNSMSIMGYPGLNPDKLKKKWSNLMQIHRKINDYQKLSGRPCYWDLTKRSERVEQCIDVFMERAVYDDMAEFVGCREGHNPSHVSDSFVSREEMQQRRARGDDSEDVFGDVDGDDDPDANEEVGEKDDNGPPANNRPAPTPHARTKKTGDCSTSEGGSAKKQRTASVATSMEILTKGYNASTVAFVETMDRSSGTMGTAISDHASAVRESGSEMAGAIVNASRILAESIASLGSMMFSGGN